MQIGLRLLEVLVDCSLESVVFADEEGHGDNGPLKVRLRNILLLYLLDIDCIAEGDAASEAAL